MAEIVEVFDDIKKGLGDKGFYLLMGAAAIFGIYNLAKGSSETSEDMASTRVVTSVSSYPDAVTNANVIIDSIQNSIDYSEGQIIDAIQAADDGMKDYLEENFTATNDYINKGFESQTDLLEKNFDELNGSITDVAETVTDIKTSNANINKAVSNMKSDLNKLSSTKKTTTKKTTTTTKKPATTKKTTTTKPKTTYYKYKTKAGYNTSTSIVDAIKVSTGDYNTPNLKAIAKANGISNYKGTYSQNVKMLSLLKQGKLKKV